MGWMFDIEKASFVGWLTDATGRAAYDPKVAHHALSLLAYMDPNSPERSGFIASTGWVGALRSVAADYNATGGHSFELVPECLSEYMRRLKRLFREFQIFGLAVGRSRDYSALKAFIDSAAYSSGSRGLFMIPDKYHMNGNFDLAKPFPALAKVADTSRWPGVLFWTPNGSAAFASIDEATELWGRLISLRDPLALDGALEAHESRVNACPKLLHLSDLHFGKPRAAEMQAILLAYARRLATDERIRRVVLTGDLFDQPRDEHALAFANFRASLEMLTGSAPVLVPGNHDQKLFGNFRWSLRQLADLEWSNLVIDDELGIVLFCFDSSRDEDWAEGRVDEDQRRAVAAAYEMKLAAKPHLATYLKIALVHHHPFTFSVPSEGLWAVFEPFGVKKESFLRMHDAEEFVRWCAMRGANLILHGHKHVPYHAKAAVQTGRNYMTVESIGCGSSTGIDSPLSMNILAFSNGCWSARSLIDQGDGSGLVNHQMQVREIEVGA